MAFAPLCRLCLKRPFQSSALTSFPEEAALMAGSSFFSSSKGHSPGTGLLSSRLSEEASIPAFRFSLSLKDSPLMLIVVEWCTYVELNITSLMLSCHLC
jgi:hypothetical protein